MKKLPNSTISTLSALVALTLQGCGGGGSSTPAPTSPPTSVSTSTSTPVPTPAPVPVPSPAPAPATLNDCLNNDALYTTGNTYEVDEKETYDGVNFTNSIFSFKVNGPTPYPANWFSTNWNTDSSANSELVDRIETVMTETSHTSRVTIHKNYSDKTSASIFAYGFEVDNVAIYYDPALIIPLDLEVGGHFSQRFTQYGISNGTLDEAHYSTTIDFLGIESVTVPAGTFVTCKIRYGLQLNPDDSGPFLLPSYEWVVKDGKYKGISIKWADSDQNPVSSGVATKVLLNGL